MKNNLAVAYLLFAACLIFFSSCDILRFKVFEVSSWSPGDGFHPNPGNLTVSLNFSLNPDRGSVEKNFSLTGNDSPVKGTFSWNGRTMTFIPLTPLEPNTDFTVNLSAEAHDSKGLSLDEAFNRSFTTREGNERPVLISCYPQMYEEIDDLRTEVRIMFSLPVPLSALYNSVSFIPSMTGSWRLENNNTLAVFTPAEPWNQQTRYEIKLSTSMTGINGMNIGNNFSSIFITNTDKEAPYILSAQRISSLINSKNTEYIELNRWLQEADADNEGWEKDNKLLLVFSEPVDWITVRNNIEAIADNAQDMPSLILESETGTEFIFRFDSNPAFESRFKIIIKPGIKDNAGNESKEEYVYKIFANDPFSKPPKLIGFRMPLAPRMIPASESEADSQLFYADTESIFQSFPISDEYYPSGKEIASWIELYFDAAADIDLFSLMSLFRINSPNYAISFSSRIIKTDNFSVPEPHEGWEEYQRIEITGILTNSTDFGIVNFQIGAGLSDILGNKNEKLQLISVIK